MKRTVLVAAAVALVSTLGLVGPSPANAVTTVRECVSTGSVEFSPPLNTSPQNGYMYWSYWADCPQQSADGSSGVVSGWHTQTLYYSGSCLTASVWGDNGVSGLLVGGTEMVLTGFSSETAAGSFTLVSQNPCFQRYASVVGVSAGVRL